MCVYFGVNFALIWVYFGLRWNDSLFVGFLLTVVSRAVSGFFWRNDFCFGIGCFCLCSGAVRGGLLLKKLLPVSAGAGGKLTVEATCCSLVRNGLCGVSCGRKLRMCGPVVYLLCMLGSNVSSCCMTSLDKCDSKISRCGLVYKGRVRFGLCRGLGDDGCSFVLRYPRGSNNFVRVGTVGSLAIVRAARSLDS